MRKRIRIVCGFVFLVIFFLSCFWLFVFDKTISPTKDDTVEYTATVSKIEINDTGKDLYIEIYTKEYDNYFLIPTGVSKHIDAEDINRIESGEEITFRVEKNMVKIMEESEFVDIVSLKTNEKNIYTLSEYNQYYSKGFLPGKIIICIIACAFLCVSGYCFVSFFLNKKR